MADEKIVPPNETRTVKIAGREVAVGIMTMGELLRVKGIFAGGKLERMAADSDLGGIIDAFPDEMMDVARVVTDLTRDELYGAQVDEFLNLCAAIIEINSDFFSRRLGPSLRNLLGQLVRMAAMSAGSQRSSF